MHAKSPYYSWYDDEGLTARTPEEDFEMAAHDGTGTPFHSLCFGVGSSWYNIVDGNTF